MEVQHLKNKDVEIIKSLLWENMTMGGKECRKKKGMNNLGKNLHVFAFVFMCSKSMEHGYLLIV